MQPNMMPGMPNQNLYAMMNQQRQNMMGAAGMGPGGMSADNYPMAQQSSPAHNAPPQSPMPSNTASSGPPGHNQSSAPSSQTGNPTNMKNNSFSPEMLQQFRAQIMAYKLFSRNQPVPESIAMAAMGMGGKNQQSGPPGPPGAPSGPPGPFGPTGPS